jgi:hypothetical protein
LLAMSKINRARTWGLALIFIGMFIMIIGLAGIVFQWGAIGRVIAIVSMVVGMITLIFSMMIYLWAGTISTSAPVVECPRCHRHTKVVGALDYCMYCHTALSFDPKYKKEATSS